MALQAQLGAPGPHGCAELGCEWKLNIRSGVQIKDAISTIGRMAKQIEELQDRTRDIEEILDEDDSDSGKEEDLSSCDEAEG